MIKCERMLLHQGLQKFSVFPAQFQQIREVTQGAAVMFKNFSVRHIGNVQLREKQSC